MKIRKPEEILEESFKIIESMIGAHSFHAEEWAVVRRIVHASGDLELATAVHFQGDAVHAGIEAIRAGVPIVTDVRMVAAGLQAEALRERAIEVHCFIDDPEVARQAHSRGLTRSYCAMEKAIATIGEAIYVVGNAPTALFALGDAVGRKEVRPRLLLAMPVGFVDVVESKELALSLDVPVIMIRGRKGGSAVAAAAVN
jgi:precorrin-8X/cobalt-precorrin-8 methylmutase